MPVFGITSLRSWKRCRLEETRFEDLLHATGKALQLRSGAEGDEDDTELVGSRILDSVSRSAPDESINDFK